MMIRFGLAESEIKPEHIVTHLPDGEGDPQQDPPQKIELVVISVNREVIFINDEQVSPADAAVELRGQAESSDDPLQRLIIVLSVAKHSQASQFEFTVDGLSCQLNN